MYKYHIDNVESLDYIFLEYLYFGKKLQVAVLIIISDIKRVFAEDIFIFHRLCSQGARGHAPKGGQREEHHFELQPVVCSGRVKTLTQQCITQVTKVTTNSQQDP